MRHRLWERTKTFAAILLSPIAEKNPVKVWSYRAPVVLSAERIIAMGSFAAWLNIAYRYPSLLNGWPLATFGVFVVLALPITRALSRAPAEATIDFAKTLVGRFGRGRAAEIVQRTTASAETPVLPEYEGAIDELWEESDPAGLGHHEIGITHRGDAPVEPWQEAPATVEDPSERVLKPGVLDEVVVTATPKTEPATVKPAPTIKAPARVPARPRGLDTLVALLGQPGSPACSAGVARLPAPLKNAYDGKMITSFRCHERLAPVFTAVFAELHRRGLWDKLRTFDGCYNPRKKRTASAQWSVHAWGAAVDLNAATNALGSGRGDMDPGVVRVFEEAGFVWGARFNDPMHMQWVESY